MTKISVIVPFYNVEKYIDRCLESLVKQTFKDIEIIVINDGSPDNSQDIVDKYVKKYKNVYSYKKENGGLSSARNYGLEKAKGEYIAFLDSDDYVELSMFEELYNKAISEDFDLVISGSNMVFDNKNIIVHAGIDSDLYSSIDIKTNMNKIYPTAWGKLYKRELFDFGIRFKCDIWYEDVEFLFKLFPYIKNIGVIDKPFVFYIQRDGAITRTFDKRVNNYISNFNGIVSFYKENGYYDKYYHELEYGYVRYLFGTMIKAASKFPNKNEYLDTVSMAIKNVNNNFPNYKKNPYLKGGLKNIYLKHFGKFFANIYYIIRRFIK